VSPSYAQAAFMPYALPKDVFDRNPIFEHR
jgi:hypothetical protein